MGGGNVACGDRRTSLSLRARVRVGVAPPRKGPAPRGVCRYRARDDATDGVIVGVSRTEIIILMTPPMPAAPVSWHEMKLEGEGRGRRAAPLLPSVPS